MANKVNISASLDPILDTSTTVDGATYTESAVNKNTGTLGGLYKSLQYDSTSARKYVGIPAGSAGAVSTDGTWKSAPTKTGSADPAKVQAIAVKFDSRNAGSNSLIRVTIGSQAHARLTVGEAVVIPISGADNGGLAKANVKIHDEQYSSGSHEANVTVILIGKAS